MCPPDTLRGAFKTIVRDRAYLLHVRLRALDALVRYMADYDRELLCALAKDSREGFATEVLALAAVCALSRCLSKDALHDLAELVGVGPEWVAFQAASHLRFVADLEVPSPITTSHQGTQFFNPADWIDVVHWLTEPERRSGVGERVHAQTRQQAELPVARAPGCDRSGRWL